MLARFSRRFHRWLTFIFGLPLAVVVLTGLMLSFEPVVQQAKPAQPITLAMIEKALARHDPTSGANRLTIRTLENMLVIGGGRSEASVAIDLASGEATAAPQGIATIFATTRRLHETLLLDLGWLVTGATIAMLLIALLGSLMGLPRIRNSLSGWHQGAAWLALPFVILSPLTGLALAYGVTFNSPQTSGAGGARVTMADAVRLVAAEHDLANLTSIRQRGRTLMARIFVSGELRSFSLNGGRLEPLARNWPRLLHEGNWGGLAGPIINAMTAIVVAGLLITGPLIWLRRALRRRRNKQSLGRDAPALR